MDRLLIITTALTPRCLITFFPWSCGSGTLSVSRIKGRYTRKVEDSVRRMFKFKGWYCNDCVQVEERAELQQRLDELHAEIMEILDSQKGQVTFMPSSCPPAFS